LKVLVTGADGFIGKNLCIHLGEKNFEVLRFVRDSNLDFLEDCVSKADAIIHLAGENRPKDPVAFETTNVGLTSILSDLVSKCNKNIPIIFTSSTQAELDSPYGLSKFAAEQTLINLTRSQEVNLAIYRLPGVFGKWCKPNYNSVVATFCHNIANGLSIKVNDATTKLKLVYVDDVVDSFIKFLSNPGSSSDLYCEINNEYEISLGELADQIRSFNNVKENLVTDDVGTGLTRALYSTYLSYLPVSKFGYELPKYSDERGDFVEMLKTKKNGQFSYFTAHPGVTRGGHYHHSKTEKFLVMRGKARFKFKNIITHEQHELIVSGDEPVVVDTVPGWSHDISNIGDTELVVMLWANEIFDRDRPDTYVMHLD
jgi:UDP-2-acetamido-2,6-beta-L-arabino-hexul-4-ose reductase